MLSSVQSMELEWAALAPGQKKVNCSCVGGWAPEGWGWHVPTGLLFYSMIVFTQHQQKGPLSTEKQTKAFCAPSLCVPSHSHPAPLNLSVHLSLFFLFGLCRSFFPSPFYFLPFPPSHKVTGQWEDGI